MNKYVLRIKGKLKGGIEVDEVLATEEFSDSYTAIEQFTHVVNPHMSKFETLEAVITVTKQIHSFRMVTCCKHHEC
jgi:hypothetical protein